MARRAHIKASDADREHIAERLRKAAGEGRLLAEELEERLGAVFSARTYGELDALVADLPAPAPVRGRRARHPTAVPAPLVLALTIPVAAAIVALVVFVVTGVLLVWMLWMAAGWWYLGRKHRMYAARYGRSWQGCGGWHSRRSSTGAHPRSWI